MEVVSPLTLNENKRRFVACSPIQNHGNVSELSDEVMMDESCGFQAAKRRRKNDSEMGGMNSGGGTSASNWMSPFAMAGGGFGSKRSRSRSPTPHKLSELQTALSTTTAELTRLKSDHSALLTSHSNLTTQNATLANENKILKKAVAIQQERQGQLGQELEMAKRVNEETNERVRRLEQINLTLRYQLQAQGMGGSEFMGFGPRPPDVY